MIAKVAKYIDKIGFIITKGARDGVEIGMTALLGEMPIIDPDTGLTIDVYPMVKCEVSSVRENTAICTIVDVYEIPSDLNNIGVEIINEERMGLLDN